jgi:hypothetical protein
MRYRGLAIVCAMLFAASTARAELSAVEAEKAMMSSPNGGLPVVPIGAAADRVTVHVKGGHIFELDVAQLVQSGPPLVTSSEGRFYVNRLTLLDNVTPDSRAEILAALQVRLAGRLGDLTSLENVASFLRTALPADRARLDSAVPTAAADVGAALLMALCGISGQDREPTMACFDANRGRAAPAIGALVARAADAIDPARPRAKTVRCSQSLGLLRDVGASARPVLPLLAGLMQADAAVLGSVGCGREEVAGTAALVALQLPQEGRVADIATRAAQTFVAERLAFGEGKSQGTLVPARLTALLDAVPLDAAMRRHLETLAAAQWARCAPLRPDMLNELGRVALVLATTIFDHWNDTGCSPDAWQQALARGSRTPAGAESDVHYLLETQLARYPGLAAPTYAHSTTQFTRDHVVEATLAAIDALRSAPASRSGAGDRSADAWRRATLRRFLADIGYVAVSFGRDGTPRFPRSSRLRWQPLAEATLAAPATPGEPAVDLAASMQTVSLANPTCRWPVPVDRVLARAGSGKALFLLSCTASPRLLIVIGSPRGFKQMHLPTRLIGADASEVEPGWALIAVSDVDRDGRLEIVTRRRACEGKGCTGVDADFDYDFSEEDGDRFTYFLRRAITPPR